MAGGLGSVLGAALGAQGARSELYEYAPKIVQNLLQKIGEVIGLDASRAKLTTAAKTDPQLPVEPGWVEAQGTRAHVGPQDSVLPKIIGQTEIRVSGRLVSVTPRAESMTLAEASTWY